MRCRGRFFGKILVVLVALALLGGAVMVLWNWVVPGLFVGAHPVDYWHALGLLALSRIFFGGFRGHSGWHGRRRWHRWKSMTAEEREQVLKGKFGAGREAEE